MKGAFLALIASTLLTISGVPEAWAGKKVVVEQFSGPNADKFRQMVTGALGKISDADMIPDKKVAAAEADLGLIQASDAYDAVAKQLKANAFVGGKVTSAKKPKATLTVRGADGAVVGEESWTAANVNKLMSDIGGDVGAKLSALLGKVGGGAAAVAEAPAEKPKAEKKAAEPEPKAEPKQEEKRQEEAVAEKPSRKAKKDEAKEEAREEKADKDDDEDTRLSARARTEDPDRDERKGGMLIDVAAGAKFFGRQFDYHQRHSGVLQKYDLPLAVTPAPTINVEFYPIKWVGVTGSFEYAKAAYSKDSRGWTYDTKNMAWMIGAKPQYDFGDFQVQGLIAFAAQQFQIIAPADVKDPPQVPGVDYRHAKLGVAGRFQVSPVLALFGGGNYLRIFSLGEIASKEYFEYAVATGGGEVFGGLAVALPFAKGLEARVTGDYKRIALDMRSDKGDSRIAGGAIDSFFGINLQLAYRNNL